MTRYYTGLLAEYIVLFWYLLKAYKPLHHRYKTYVGEIDLILQKRQQIIFVEVKARKLGLTENTISQLQCKRVTRAAEFFIAQNLNYRHYNLRFDLVVVSAYRLPLIIKNAW